MIAIVGETGCGKTKKLLAEAQDCYVLCKNPEALYTKALAYGLGNVKCEHYSQFLHVKDSDYYIDDAKDFLEWLGCDGFTISTD